MPPVLALKLQGHPLPAAPPEQYEYGKDSSGRSDGDAVGTAFIRQARPRDSQTQPTRTREREE